MTTSNTTGPAGALGRYGVWAVVTGASEGIGREFAICLGKAGVNLVLVARREAVLREPADELGRKHGIVTRTIAADLAHRDGMQAVIEGTRELDVGVLVAAAGFGTSGSFVDSPMEEELAMLDANCCAVAVLAHHFGKRFAERRRGALVLMSSLLAFQGVPGAANYAATEAYVQSLAEGLRAELRPFGVDVIASAPGPIRSGFANRAQMTMSVSGTPASVAPARLQALGRVATVRPGFLSKFLEFSLALLPRWGRGRIMGRVMAGMTKHSAAQAT